MWSEEPEWKAFLSHFITRKKLEGDSIFYNLYKFWEKHPELTMADFEINLRKRNSFLRFFAEEVGKQTYCHGSKYGMSPSGKKTYIWAFSTHSQEENKKIFHSCYFDEDLNLIKLKDTGFAVLESSEQQVIDAAKGTPNSHLSVLNIDGAIEFYNTVMFQTLRICVENQFAVVLDSSIKKEFEKESTKKMLKSRDNMIDTLFTLWGWPI